MFKTIIAISSFLAVWLSGGWRINGESQASTDHTLSTKFGSFYTDGFLNSPASEDLSPFAYYKMDDYASSYTVLDSSGYNRNATCASETTELISYSGLIDQSLTFYSTYGGLQLNETIPPIMSGDFSFAVWMKIAEGNSALMDTAIFFSPQNENWNFARINNNGYLGAILGGTYCEFNVNTVPTWHHVVFVKSGTTFTIYYDGVSVGTIQTGVHYATSWVWFDGAQSNYNPSQVDELIFYNRSLTAQQVTDLYESYEGRPIYTTANFDTGYWIADMGIEGACNLEYNTRKYIAGEALGTLPSVVNNNPLFSFVRWTDDNGEPFDEQSVLGAGWVALHASWITVSPLCTLYFDSQGGSSGWEYWDLYEGFTFEIPYFGHFWPADPVYEGYVFGGWFSGSGGTGSPINPQGIYESMIFGTGYMYAFAYWTLPPITFTFTSGVPPLGWGTEQTDIPDIENYVTYDYTEISYGSGAEITALPTASVTGPRYTFTGYWYEPYYCVVYQVGSYAPQNNYPFGGPIPLYTMWTDNGYQGQVTFDLQGGNGDTPTIHLFEGYVFSTGDFGQMVWPTTPTYDGYTFGGWWTDVGGTGNLIEYDTTWYYAVYPLNVTLYAYWIAN